MKRHVNTVKAQTRLHFVPKYLYFVLISVSCYLKVLQRKNSKVMTDVVLCVQWQKYWWKCKRFCCEQPPEITGVVGFRCEADMRRLCLGSSSEFNIFTNWTKCFNISASFNFPFNVFVMVPRPQASPSPSPVGYSPMTPGAPSPGGYNPHTPGSNIEQGGSDWVTTDILVRVKDSFMDLMGQTGVIRSVTVTNTVTSSTAWHHQIRVMTSHQLSYWSDSDMKAGQWNSPSVWIQITIHWSTILHDRWKVETKSLSSPLIEILYFESPMGHFCVRRVQYTYIYTYIHQLISFNNDRK